MLRRLLPLLVLLATVLPATAQERVLNVYNWSDYIDPYAVARFTRTGSFPHWADWFADDAPSGGVVLDLMVHDLDIARWVMGEVTEVYATASREPLPVTRVWICGASWGTAPFAR